MLRVTTAPAARTHRSSRPGGLAEKSEIGEHRRVAAPRSTEESPAPEAPVSPFLEPRRSQVADRRAHARARSHGRHRRLVSLRRGNSPRGRAANRGLSRKAAIQRPVALESHVGGPRALPLAARRARELAALRPARGDRGGHRLGEDRRGDRRRLRRAAPGSVRARGRAVAGADGAVARPRWPRRCPSARIGRLGDSGTRRPGLVRRARCHPSLGRRAQAGASGRGRRTAHRRRVPRPRRRRSCAGRCSPSTRNGSGSPRRWSAATTRSPSCCCRTSGASATATASSRPSPTGCARRPRVAFVGVELSVEERGRVHRDRAAARQRTPAPPPGARACRSSRSATSSPRWRTSPSATPAPTAAPRATTSTRSRSGGRSWRSRAASTSCSAASRRAISDADGALVFTETVRAANHAINRLDPLVSIDLITGSTARRQRREILDDLRVRQLDAVAAPRVLDEGIDVPDANLGIVMSASRTRRQMIQRMGRILRRKRPGVAARFVIMFAKDTLEDPAQPRRARRLPRRDRAHLRGDRRLRRRALRRARRVPRRARPGGRPEPEHLERYERARLPRRRRAGVAIDDAMVASLADAIGVEVAYALATFAPGDDAGRARDDAIRGLDARLPRPTPTAVPRARARRRCRTIAKPRVEPKRLSTGQRAARDRAHRVRVAHQLHRLRRSIAARAVPVAGPRPDRARAAANKAPRSLQ